MVKRPLSFQIAACAIVAPERHTWSQCKWLFTALKLESGLWANWAEVPGGQGLASMVSKFGTTEYPALIFPSKTKLLPSVYLISSG